MAYEPPPVPLSFMPSAPALCTLQEIAFRYAFLILTLSAVLQDLFRPFGPISRIYVAYDRETREARGFAFINFMFRFTPAHSFLCIGMGLACTLAAHEIPACTSHDISFLHFAFQGRCAARHQQARRLRLR